MMLIEIFAKVDQSLGDFWLKDFLGCRLGARDYFRHTDLAACLLSMLCADIPLPRLGSRRSGRDKS